MTFLILYYDNILTIPKLNLTFHFEFDIMIIDKKKKRYPEIGVGKVRRRASNQGILGVLLFS